MRLSENRSQLCLLTFGKSYSELTDEERREFRRAVRTTAYYGRHDYNKKKQRTDKKFRKRDILKALHWEERCQRCGYSKCLAALEFHHKDPSTKDGLVGTQATLHDATIEAKKCELICANCHRELHFREGRTRMNQPGRPRKPLSPIVAAYMRHAGVTRPEST